MAKLLKSLSLFVGSLRSSLNVHVSAAWQAFDRRDVFFFGGLSMLGYGLYLYSPSVSFSVCGGILLIVGLAGYLFEGAK